MAEYKEVLGRPRLGIHPLKVKLALKHIREASLLVAPTKSITAALDPDDNIFLECAEAAHAAYLVTGNRRHFPEHWKKTRVIGPRELMDVLIEKAD